MSAIHKQLGLAVVLALGLAGAGIASATPILVGSLPRNPPDIVLRGRSPMNKLLILHWNGFVTSSLMAFAAAAQAGRAHTRRM